MIDMHSKYDNMHKNGLFDALICINNHIIACVNCMLSSSSYFITFIDNFSWFGWVYLVRYESKAFYKIWEFKNEVEKQCEKDIKTLRSNQGDKYLST